MIFYIIIREVIGKIRKMRKVLIQMSIRLMKFIPFILVAMLLTSVLPAQHVATAATVETPFSWDNATVYFVITDRFVNGNQSNDNSFGRKKVDTSGSNIGTFHGGDVKGLTQKINEGYFTKLGVDALWITAPYEQIHGWVAGGSIGEFAHYAYHGYYPLDWTAMDPNMGTIDEFREFVDTAHAKGIRVVLDVVMNHAGYGTLQDMATYGFGGADAIANGATWDPIENNLSYGGMHGIIDYNSVDAWKNWWGKWVRAGLPGYTPAPPLADDEIKGQLAYLPDMRTDLKTSVGLPPILINKWKKEATGFEKWKLPKAAELRKDLNVAPGDYLVQWLAAWVEEFGIDGFRADTAKHVEMWRWKQLADASDAALKKWRANNPTKPGAQWKDDFWMTAEVFGLGIGKNQYHTSGGFDSTINFKFQSEPSYLNQIDDTYREYAQTINSNPSANALSYISSHDTMLYDRTDLYNGGTGLLLAPGAVQIFYGDESGRPLGKNGADKDQGTRSAMNWSKTDANLLMHWQKIGSFRNKHIAIGAGTHQKLTSKPYTFARTYDKNGISDRVVVAIGAKGLTTIPTSGVFADGTRLRDHYTNRTALVSGGKVSIQAAANGVILLETFADYDQVAKLASPTGVAFSRDASGAKLTWNAVANANRYQIYVNSEQVGSTTDKTSFTLNTSKWKKGLAQQIEVTAVSPEGESLPSTLITGTIPKDVIQIVGKKVTVNGKPLPGTVEPQTIDGRLYVPFKSMFTPFGVSATWNNQTKVLSANKQNFSLIMTANAKTAKRNGATVKLDAPLRIINGTTYVPLRFVGDSLDATIQYRAK
jgi:alpha-amylase